MVITGVDETGLSKGQPLYYVEIRNLEEDPFDVVSLIAKI